MSRTTLWVSLQCLSPRSLSIVIRGGMMSGAATNTLSELYSMPTTRRNDPTELLRLALIGFDAQIAELQEKRAHLAALIDQRSAHSAAETAAPQKRRKLSAAARAKISAARKARRANERKGKAEKQKPNAAAKTARAKAKPIEPAPARTKAKKSTAEKDQPTKNNLA